MYETPPGPQPATPVPEGEISLRIGNKIGALSNRFYDAIRHRDSAKAHPAPPGTDFSLLQGHEYAILETFRSNGESVPTPVWFGLADGRAYIRTMADVGKVRRIRANGRARLAPCSMRGRPLGPAIEGRARIVAPQEEVHAEAALAAAYGLTRKLYEGTIERMGTDLVYLEVAPEDEAGAAVATG